MKNQGELQKYSNSFTNYLGQVFKKKGKKIQFKKGQLIIQPENNLQYCYYLSFGIVKNYVLTTAGKEQILGFLVPGFFFSQAGAVHQEFFRELYYEATTSTTVYRLNSSVFFEILKTDVHFARDIIQQYRLLLFYMIDFSTVLSIAPVSHRIEVLLLFIGLYFGNIKGNQMQVVNKITQEEIANMLSTTRESVGVNLSRLKKMGFVEIKNRHIVIPDLKRLEKFLLKKNLPVFQGRPYPLQFRS